MTEPRNTDFTTCPATVPLDAEDQARADLYGLIGSFLLGPPDVGLLAVLARADPLSVDPHAAPASPLDRAWENLRIAATVMDERALKDEYAALFISTGTPLLNPYESLYIAGHMMEKPLAKLRDELRALGLARRAGAFELEDHLGSLCETMRILITEARPLELQHAFFEHHIASWYARFLRDMRSAPGANFTRHLADFADAFFAIEAEAFGMEMDHDIAEGARS
ncbi:TorD/DmsD family molecular chaperone [Noviherbaspirillum pedocola]|uniref:Molecular chaperone TorD family protein n=1 Tax=Noviherbaspirillum pedocola TaxID=2801341 RepID=A0A934T1A0_9BURK|nr:molecular chaperone TorD family protein [Noviherbaspirillum pedocola]MBK4735638.1 molecular chaperone TorD family protein [Noviherbaspirillum pedocola]